MFFIRSFFWFFLSLSLLMTTLQASSHKWVAVFAKGTGYTAQAYDSRGDWRGLKVRAGFGGEVLRRVLDFWAKRMKR